MNISFETLPTAIHELILSHSALTQQVADLAQQLNGNRQGKEVMNVGEAAKYLGKTVPAIYTLVHRGCIPYYKPDKNLMFLRDELLDWVKKGAQSAVNIESSIIRRNVVGLNKHKVKNKG